MPARRAMSRTLLNSIQTTSPETSSRIAQETPGCRTTLPRGGNSPNPDSARSIRLRSFAARMFSSFRNIFFRRRLDALKTVFMCWQCFIIYGSTALRFVFRFCRDSTGHRTFHSLRHSFVSELANAGIAPDVRQMLAGHSDDRSHAVYTHTQLDTLRAAVKKLPSIKR